jgi:hypothetical protein
MNRWERAVVAAVVLVVAIDLTFGIIVVAGLCEEVVDVLLGTDR